MNQACDLIQAVLLDQTSEDSKLVLIARRRYTVLTLAICGTKSTEGPYRATIEPTVGGKISLRKTRTIRDLRKHFLHKGKVMQEGSREISPRIVRRRAQAHDDALKGVAASVKGLHPKRILDVGTGYGTNLTFLARRFGKCSRIWSVDASPAVVHEIKTRMRKHQYSRHVFVKEANAERLPFKSDHFELVVSLFSLHHLSDPKRGLFEMRRVSIARRKTHYC